MRMTKQIATADDLAEFVDSHGAGATAIYHRGYLAADIDSESSILSNDARDQLFHLAEAAYALCRAGHIHLVQRRDGDVFVYLAVCSHKRSSIPPSPLTQLSEAT